MASSSPAWVFSAGRQMEMGEAWTRVQLKTDSFLRGTCQKHTFLEACGHKEVSEGGFHLKAFQKTLSWFWKKKKKKPSGGLWRWKNKLEHSKLQFITTWLVPLLTPSSAPIVSSELKIKKKNFRMCFKNTSKGIRTNRITIRDQNRVKTRPK